MKLPRLIGDKHEKQAERYLKKQGLKLLTRNFLCRFGEIDLIMTQNELLIFIEVRARNSQAFGSAIETVDFRKQMKIIKTAKYFLQQKDKLSYNAIRFDVIGIQSDTQELQWIKNAFIID